MGHYKSLHSQVYDALTSKNAFGDSRHRDLEYDRTHNTNHAFDKIYSFKTLDNYRQSCNRFVDYCKDNYGCKTLEQCEKHINDYIQQLRLKDENGLSKTSAYTQKSYLSAIGKMYGKSYFDKVETDVRHRADITRSRLETLQNFNETKNAELKEFCQSTGLRRCEIENIKGRDLIEKNGQYYIHIERGIAKGGKERDVLILNQNQNVIDKMQQTNQDDKVWGKVHSHCPIHTYRGDYANALYNQLARDTSTLSYREVYHCKSDMAGRHFDKVAMKEVSENLGHNRIDVIAQNYLR